MCSKEKDIRETEVIEIGNYLVSAESIAHEVIPLCLFRIVVSVTKFKRIFEGEISEKTSMGKIIYQYKIDLLDKAPDSIKRMNSGRMRSG